MNLLVSSTLAVIAIAGITNVPLQAQGPLLRPVAATPLHEAPAELSGSASSALPPRATSADSSSCDIYTAVGEVVGFAVGLVYSRTHIHRDDWFGGWEIVYWSAGVAAGWLAGDIVCHLRHRA